MAMVIKIMRKKARKITIIITSVAVAVVLVAAALSVVFTAEVNLIKPERDEITVEVFSEFNPSDTSAEISVLGIANSHTVAPKGELNTAKLGSYTLTYKAGFLFNTKTETCTVKVVDTVPPKINCETLNLQLEEGQATLAPEEVKVDFSAADNYDGDITDKVQITVEGHTCRLSVSDSSGNTADHLINLIPSDREYPTISLSGTSTYFLHVGTDYKEPGYSAKDNMDGNLTRQVRVNSNLDNSKAGEYTITYSVSDKSGNTTKVTRKVVVYGAADADSFKDVPANGKVVYLTFDDGPGPYTEEVLRYLRRYNVKATFFVTNQNPRYQNLIANIDREGHALGVHTLTHKWSIYKSEENYYNDFNAMLDIIKAQTGKTTNIFRFPGGTTNSVSKGNKGIMTRLSTQMLEQGYYYFDWNVDCNDARTTDTQKIISDTLKQIKTKDNAVVLMHDIKKQTVAALPAIIEKCLSEGYTFAVLTEDSPAIRFSPRN